MVEKFACPFSGALKWERAFKSGYLELDPVICGMRVTNFPT